MSYEIFIIFGTSDAKERRDVTTISPEILSLMFFFSMHKHIVINLPLKFQAVAGVAPKGM